MASIYSIFDQPEPTLSNTSMLQKQQMVSTLRRAYLVLEQVFWEAHDTVKKNQIHECQQHVLAELLHQQQFDASGFLLYCLQDEPQQIEWLQSISKSPSLITSRVKTQVALEEAIDELLNCIRQ